VSSHRDNTIWAIKRAAVWLFLAAFLLGAFLGRVKGVSAGVPVFTFIFMVLLLLLAFFKRPAIFFILVMVVALLTGYCRQVAQGSELKAGRKLLEYVELREVRALFRLDSIPDRRPGYTVIWAEMIALNNGNGWKDSSGRVRIAMGDALENIYAGDRAVGIISMSKPHGFRNPGAFDYVSYLERRGVSVTGWIDDSSKIIKVNDRSFSLLGSMDRTRQGYIKWLRERKSDGSLLLAALMAGDRSGLPDEVVESFEELGLSHLLSISGLHLGLAATAFYVVLLFFFKRTPRVCERIAAQRLAAILTVPIVISYAAMTGMRVPTQRALVMVLCLLVAVALDKKHEAWNALGVAALVVLFIWPSAILEASFQMSFAAVAGILYGWPRIAAIAQGKKSEAERELDRLERIYGLGGSVYADKAWRYLSGLIVVSVIVQFTVMPLQLSHFHSINPLAPIYNLLLVPFFGIVIIPLGLLGSLLFLVNESMASVLISIPEFGCSVMIKASSFLSEKAPTLLVLPGLAKSAALLWYLAGIGLLEGSTAWRNGMWSWNLSASDLTRWRLFGQGPKPNYFARKSWVMSLLVLSPILACTVGSTLVWPSWKIPEKGLFVCAFEVGQAQSIFIRTPEGGTMLVDGGGFFKSDYDVGKGIIAPALLSMGIKHIDVVALSHPHPDHAGGLSFILRHFDVDEFWRSGASNIATERLDKSARERGIPLRILEEGDAGLTIGKAAVSIFHPGEGPFDQRELNDASLVLKISCPQGSVLVPGDVEEVSEGRLVSKYGPDGEVKPRALSAELLVVPHHGSRTSSTSAFIDAVSPVAALVSAAGPDRTGLPADDVIKRYSDRGVQILRTDQTGFSAVLLNEQYLTIFSGEDLAPTVRVEKAMGGDQ